MARDAQKLRDAFPNPNKKLLCTLFNPLSSNVPEINGQFADRADENETNVVEIPTGCENNKRHSLLVVNFWPQIPDIQIIHRKKRWKE